MRKLLKFAILAFEKIGAERQGFEPRYAKDVNGFQDRRIQPLCHLSDNYFLELYKFCDFAKTLKIRLQLKFAIKFTGANIKILHYTRKSFLI